MHIKPYIPKNVNPDLQKERDSANFDVNEFKIWWYDGVDKLKEKQEIEKVVLKDRKDAFLEDYLSHEELYNLTVKRVGELGKILEKLQKELDPNGKDIFPIQMFGLASLGFFSANHCLATHSTMFVDVIKGQGTPEQIEKFGIPAEKCQILGTYAQTELGHGTNVRGIETRADYDQKTDEFILNTPNLQAYKWWPGGLGHTSNYAMVVAQLYINNVHKGIQMFIVPVRDVETHLPLAGIDIGEVGRKLGMNGVNQGFLGFDNVRIPRTNMLMKNAIVERNGNFSQGPTSKIAYMTMVYTRCLIVLLDTVHLAQAATIATRYSAVRRQSPINPNEPEPQIIDHVTQQLKLFPEIATATAYHMAGRYLWNVFNQTLLEINNGRYDRLIEIHILSSVLKVLCTTDACAGIERLRLSCGGHGFLSAANFGNIYGNAVAAYTYEGENTVLLLQVGKFLVKMWLNIVNGKSIPESVTYLQQAVNDEVGKFKWDSSHSGIVKALQYVAAHKTRHAFENIRKYVEGGKTQEEAFNNAGIETVQSAELHGRQYIADVFYQIIKQQKNDRSSALQAVLENLLELYLVQTTLNQLNHIMTFIHLTEDDVISLQQRLKLALKAIRPNAVTICDGFDYHDAVLSSVLGSYDGNVYERIFDAAKKSPLNQKPVQDSFETYLKPFMKSSL